MPIGLEKNEYGSGLYIYPNPFNGLVTISYTSNILKEEFTIDITNSLGIKVYDEGFKNISNSFEKQIDFGTLPKGIYYVRMQAIIQDTLQKRRITKTAKLVLQ